MSAAGGKRSLLGRILLTLLTLLIVADLGAWGLHVWWRDRALERLEPVVRQMDRLEGEVRRDDAWIERNSRLAQEYAQHGDFAQRVAARGRRVRTHDALVESYNEQLRYVYRRFYLAPLPAPHPPLREKLGGEGGG